MEKNKINKKGKEGCHSILRKNKKELQKNKKDFKKSKIKQKKEQKSLSYTIKRKKSNNKNE